MRSSRLALARVSIPRGSVEVISAILLLIPKMASVSAMVLAGIMIGAIATGILEVMK
jgi:uncharacterized membrane protein YphA (DoxX/SURF4 family)